MGFVHSLVTMPTIPMSLTLPARIIGSIIFPRSRIQACLAETPTGAAPMMNLFEVSREISNRLTRIFLRDEAGRRPVYGGTEKFQTDPHWKDYILFYEYFHGDNGAGLGAAHQTGWTGVIAKLIELFGRLDAHELLDAGKAGGF